MVQKIKRKILFLCKVLSCGADGRSKCILFLTFVRLTTGRKGSTAHKPFSCYVHAGNRSALIHFSGTMSEIHTMVDIFVDHSYEPKHTHTQTLFGGHLDTLLDLGANIGLATVWFALMHPDIRIDAYEPNPHVFAYLQKNTAPFPTVRIFQKAITSTVGTAEFYQSPHTLESSVFTMRDSSVITVETTTLDSAVETIGGHVDLVKIDIEGSEFDVFAHSHKLKHIRAMIGEAHTKESGHAEGELSTLLSSFDLLEIYNPRHNDVFGFYAAHTATTKESIAAARSSHV